MRKLIAGMRMFIDFKDELRLIADPLIAGEGKALFATTQHRRGLELRNVQQCAGGRVSLIYGIN